MNSKLRFVFASIVLALRAACAGVDAPPSVTPLVPTLAATETIASPTPVPAPPIGPLVVRVWLPPRFDPASNPILQTRLAAFEEAHPGLKLDIRLKDETGDASLFASLERASQAAPAALPDLIALPHPDLERAAQAGLIQALDASLPEDSSLPLSARTLGHAQNAAYGLPFAMDALALGSVFRPTSASWTDILAAGPITFNQNDASFTLALYLAAGGPLADEQGHPMLDEATLARVLTLFTQEAVTGAESDAAVWEALGAEEGGYAVGWYTSSLGRARPEAQLEALPGFEEASATLVTGWSWSLASAEGNRRQIALELAAWLTEKEFLAAWNESTGWLSPLDVNWPGRVMPATQLAPLFSQATLAVLAGASPEAAARDAVEQARR